MSLLLHLSRGTFVLHSHHRTCELPSTAVSQRVIGFGTDVPAATLSLQTDCSAALSRLSRVSPNMNMLLSSRAVCIYLMDS